MSLFQGVRSISFLHIFLLNNISFYAWWRKRKWCIQMIFKICFQWKQSGWNVCPKQNSFFIISSLKSIIKQMNFFKERWSIPLRKLIISKEKILKLFSVLKIENTALNTEQLNCGGREVTNVMFQNFEIASSFKILSKKFSNQM